MYGGVVTSERPMRLGLAFSLLAAASPAYAQDLAAHEANEPPEWTPPPPGAASVRGLPLCPPDAVDPAPGEPYTCRPAWPDVFSHWSIAFGLSFGAVSSEAPLLGPGVMVDGAIDFWPTRSLGLGARYGYLVSGDAGLDEDGDGADDADSPNLGMHLVGAGPRLRLYTDETARQMWSLSLDGGWAIDKAALVDDGPFVRATIAREVGGVDSTAADLRGRIGLTYVQGLGQAADLRALMLELGFGIGWGIPEPLDLDEHWSPAPFLHTFGFEMAFLSLHLAQDRELLTFGYLFGFHFGVQVAEWLEPRARIGMQYQPIPDGADGMTLFTGSAGAQLRLSSTSSPYLELMGGYGFAYGTEPRAYDDGPFVDVTAGWQVGGCNAGFDFGIRYRRGVGTDNADLHALFLLFDMSYRSVTDAIAIGDCRPGPATVPLPPPPPPPPPTPPPPLQTEIEVGGQLEVDVPSVGAEIAVEVEPVVIEVTLGAWLFGGAVRLEIRPESLPLARMRDAGFVSIQIVGPSEAIARARAEVGAVLSREGLRVDAMTTALADTSEIRAIVTIWPPGSRPH